MKKYFQITIICLIVSYLTSCILAEIYCYWYPLIDTRHSRSFNIKNIGKIELGMSKKAVLELIGDPLFVRTRNDGTELYKFTDDGNAQLADYAWFKVSIEFRNEMVEEIDIGWVHD
jgi:outer membrane protein assembly factor BamE (lipoprotein component of BamABCDE complex)